MLTYSAYIFDLDGTLLDTLPDLVRLTNYVLEKRGWPTHSQDEILSYVGDGGLKLLERAAPIGTSSQDLDNLFKEWRSLYPTFGHEKTQPFEGIVDLLKELKAQGKRLGVLSNKFDDAVKTVISNHFGNTFDYAFGECGIIPRKPNPQGLLHVITLCGVPADQVLYIGDSACDIEVAKNAHVASAAVSWGYEDIALVKKMLPDYVVDRPDELLAI